MTARVSKRRKDRSRPLYRGDAQRNRVKHLPLSVTLIIALWVAGVSVLLFSTDRMQHSALAEGQKAPATVVSAVSFTCEDVGKTELSRQHAADAVYPIFSLNSKPLEISLRNLEGQFERLRNMREEPGTETVRQAPASPDDEFAAPVSWVPAGLESNVYATARSALEQVWSRGIISREEYETRFQDVALFGRLELHAGGETNRTATLESLYQPDGAALQVVRRIISRIPETAAHHADLHALVSSHIAPCLVYEPEKTSEQKQLKLF